MGMGIDQRKKSVLRYGEFMHRTPEIKNKIKIVLFCLSIVCGWNFLIVPQTILKTF